MTAIANRYEFVLLFDVANGNPNGDPDAGNLPRIDPETSLGLVTDVCLKRKIRNFVEMAHEGESGFEIYVKEGAVLNDQNKKAYLAVRGGEVEAPTKGKKEKLDPKDDAEAGKLREFMTSNFFDVRTFGAVMTTGVNCGQVRGPVQIGFATSIEPVMPIEVTITRMAATTQREKTETNTSDDGNQRVENRTMGRKHILPYALYRAHGFISAPLAEKAGFTDHDLEVLLGALTNMFDHDRSAARGEMSNRTLVVFKHDSKLGNAPANKLFELVTVGRNVDGKYYDIGDRRLDNAPKARAFHDYAVRINTDQVPEGVKVIELV
ncbi:type I-C CRISPR-associated protein Cas7/Csd2 [Rhizobium laguerreae]|nr:type I-C CRISPR-associated protein Cas7/Csd2 [Rhizobium laguerreae]